MRKTSVCQVGGTVFTLCRFGILETQINSIKSNLGTHYTIPLRLLKLRNFLLGTNLFNSSCPVRVMKKFLDTDYPRLTADACHLSVLSLGIPKDCGMIRK